MERFVNVDIGGSIYSVSNLGRIVKRRGKGFIKCFPDKDGYPRVSVYSGKGKTYNEALHRVVYRAFNGDIPEGMTVDHIDENKLNPEVTNLQLMSAVDNAIKGNARNWVVVTPDGDKLEVYNLRAFCKEHGLHGGHMASIATGNTKLKSYKGWSCYERT